MDYAQTTAFNTSADVQKTKEPEEGKEVREEEQKSKECSEEEEDDQITEERSEEKAEEQKLEERSEEEEEKAHDTSENKSNADGDLVSEAGTFADSDVDLFEPDLYNANIRTKHPQRFRYEITYCGYHLKKVEELWQPADRHGPQWEEFDSLRSAFFQDDSPFFLSWNNVFKQSLGFNRAPDTAMHYAAWFGLSSLLARLVARGLDMNQFSISGNSALDFAIEYYGGAKRVDTTLRNALETFEVLLRGGLDPNAVKTSSSFISLRYLLVHNPGLDAVQLFLDYHADAKAINGGSKISVLHTCCQFCDDPRVLGVILEAGADIAVKDDRGQSPLHSMMSRFKIPLEFVSRLLEAGANVNEEDLTSQRS
jgi:ankyrin repeat protein